MVHLLIYEMHSIDLRLLYQYLNEYLKAFDLKALILSHHDIHLALFVVLDLQLMIEVLSLLVGNLFKQECLLD